MRQVLHPDAGPRIAVALAARLLVLGRLKREDGAARDDQRMELRDVPVVGVRSETDGYAEALGSEAALFGAFDEEGLELGRLRRDLDHYDPEALAVRERGDVDPNAGRRREDPLAQDGVVFRGVEPLHADAIRLGDDVDTVALRRFQAEREQPAVSVGEGSDLSGEQIPAVVGEPVGLAFGLQPVVLGAGR